MSKLTNRERWLMREAFQAGWGQGRADGEEDTEQTRSFDDWLEETVQAAGLATGYTMETALLKQVEPVTGDVWTCGMAKWRPDGCGNPAEAPHACPYAVDINGNHDPRYCRCCEDCEHECALDI